MSPASSVRRFAGPLRPANQTARLRERGTTLPPDIPPPATRSGQRGFGTMPKMKGGSIMSATKHKNAAARRNDTARAPEVLTLAEAAAYLRVVEGALLDM